MKRILLYFALAAGISTNTSCKKDKSDASLRFDGTANVISGEWMMNGVTPDPQEPRSTIIPKYQFGTNMRYTFTQGIHLAPKTETGEYFIVQRPPIDLYVLVMKPDKGAEYNIELHIQANNTASFGSQVYYRRR